jgi:hypothetical protein
MVISCFTAILVHDSCCAFQMTCYSPSDAPYKHQTSRTRLKSTSVKQVPSALRSQMQPFPCCLLPHPGFKSGLGLVRQSEALPFVTRAYPHHLNFKHTSLLGCFFPKLRSLLTGLQKKTAGGVQSSWGLAVSDVKTTENPEHQHSVEHVTVPHNRHKE